MLLPLQPTPFFLLLSLERPGTERRDNAGTLLLLHGEGKCCSRNADAPGAGAVSAAATAAAAAVGRHLEAQVPVVLAGRERGGSRDGRRRRLHRRRRPSPLQLALLPGSSRSH
jgi:hypothetical protein